MQKMPEFGFIKTPGFILGKFDKGVTTTYSLKKEGNGVYAFILSGKVTIDGQELETRDGFGIWDVNALAIKANKTQSFY
jgi:redox-sensitive bicupin YhaK (pirin superfamily)